MSRDEDITRRMELEEVFIPRCHDLLNSYFEHMGWQVAHLAKLQEELGRINERLGD